MKSTLLSLAGSLFFASQALGWTGARIIGKEKEESKNSPSLVWDGDVVDLIDTSVHLPFPSVIIQSN